MGGWRRLAGRGPLVAATLVLTLGLTVIGVTVGALHRRDVAGAGQIMEQRTEIARTAVAMEARRYIDLLRIAADGLGTAARIDDRSFRAATAAFAGADLPGATSVVLVAAVPGTQVAAAQARWRDAGAQDLRLRPMSGGAEHLFTVFARPLDGTVVTLGVDLSQAAEPTAALVEARRTGAVAVSDAYVLLRDRGLPEAQRQRSFVFATPVRNGGTFAGWLVMGLHGQDFLGEVLARAGQGVLGGSLEATDGADRRTSVAAVPAPGRADLHRQRMLTVADRRWTLRTAADAGRLRGGHSAMPLTVGVTGGVIVLLLTGLVHVLATGRVRAEQRVAAATAGLRAAERDARRQSALLSAVMNSIGDGVGVVDEHGEFLLHNRAAKRLLGVEDDVDGADAWQEHYGIFRTDGMTPFPAEELPLVRAIAGEASTGVEMVIRNPARPDGVLICVDGCPLETGDGRHGAVAVFRDITELRRYEADLAAFAGVVAHDLKSPLAIVSGNCETADEILAEVLTDPSSGDRGAWRPAVEEAREMIGQAVGGVQRMGTLIDDLLAYTTARDAPLRLRAVDLAALVGEVVAARTGRGAVAAGGSPPRIFVGDLPDVIADPSMLRRVLENLIGNAIKYVRPGDIAHVDVTGTADAVGWAHIEVADRGIGIPDADKPQIFDTFHRAHAGAGYAGTGLGLAICRRIVERHGGTLSVGDNPGGGTRFQFTLPLATPLRAPAHPSGPAAGVVTEPAAGRS